MTPPAPQECNHSSVCRFRFVHDPPCYDLTCHSYSRPAPSPDALITDIEDFISTSLACHEYRIVNKSFIQDLRDHLTTLRQQQEQQK